MSNSSAGIQNLMKIKEIAQDTIARYHLAQNTDQKFDAICEGIRKNWELKLNWGPHILTQEVCNILSILQANKISTYKLVGSGGSGFILVLADEHQILHLKKIFDPKDLINFSLSDEGTKVISIEQ